MDDEVPWPCLNSVLLRVFPGDIDDRNSCCDCTSVGVPWTVPDADEVSDIVGEVDGGSAWSTLFLWSSFWNILGVFVFFSTPMDFGEYSVSITCGGLVTDTT